MISWPLALSAHDFAVCVFGSNSPWLSTLLVRSLEDQYPFAYAMVNPSMNANWRSPCLLWPVVNQVVLFLQCSSHTSDSAPSISVVKKRLIDRKTESNQDLLLRIEKMESEIMFSDKMDYKLMFFWWLQNLWSMIVSQNYGNLIYYVGKS